MMHVVQKQCTSPPPVVNNILNREDSNTFIFFQYITNIVIQELNHKVVHRFRDSCIFSPSFDTQRNQCTSLCCWLCVQLPEGVKDIQASKHVHLDVQSYAVLIIYDKTGWKIGLGISSGPD